MFSKRKQKKGGNSDAPHLSRASYGSSQSSNSTGSPFDFVPPQTLKLNARRVFSADDVSSMNDSVPNPRAQTRSRVTNKTSSNTKSELDRLLELIPEDDKSVSVATIPRKTNPTPWSTSASLAESEVTCPTANSTTGKPTTPLTSLFYLRLLPTHEGSESFDNIHFASPQSPDPRKVIISSVQTSIQHMMEDEDILPIDKDSEITRRGFRMKDVLQRNVLSLKQVDEAMLYLLSAEKYDQVLETYEVLRSALLRRVPNSDLVRPLLSRLSIISLLANKERKSFQYCRKLVECSDLRDNQFLESLIQLGFVQFAWGDLDRALQSWREAAYKVSPTNQHHYAALLWNNLACLQLFLGDSSQSFRSLQQSLGIQKKLMKSSKNGTPQRAEQALLDIACTLQNAAVISEVLGNVSSSISYLEESLLLQESILKEVNGTVVLAQQHLERLSEKLQDEQKTRKTAFGRGRNNDCDDVDDVSFSSRSNDSGSEWDDQHLSHGKSTAATNNSDKNSNPVPGMLFDDVLGSSIPLPRCLSITEGAAGLDFLSLGPILQEYSAAERVRETCEELFAELRQSDSNNNNNANTALSSRQRSSIPIDVDAVEIPNADQRLQSVYEQVKIHLAKNEIDDAMDLLKATLRSHREKYTALHPLVASTLHNMGLVLLKANRYNAAQQHFQQARDIRIRTLGEQHMDVVSSQLFLGLIQVAGREFDDALVTFSHSLQSLRRMLGYYDHPLLVKVLNNIACVHYECGGDLAAIKALEEGIEIERGLLSLKSKSSTSPSTASSSSPARTTVSSRALSVLLDNLGFLKVKQRKFGEAIKLYEEALFIKRDTHKSDDHPSIHILLENLAFAMASQSTAEPTDSATKRPGGKEFSKLIEPYLDSLRCNF